MPFSPMMQQYLELKQGLPDTILLFRLGDFYEMFFDDAVTASRELDLVLTGRDCGMDQRAPMCGIPFHAVEGYISRLVEQGYKVAICEQTTLPGDQKGIVSREITRIITPGTILDSDALDQTSNNYIASIYLHDNKAAVVWMDITTGEFNHSYIEPPLGIGINEILSRIQPSEIICNAEMLAESVNLSIVKYGGVCPFSAYNETCFDFDNAKLIVTETLSQKDVKSIRGREEVVCAAGALLSYIKETQKISKATITKVEADNEIPHLGMDMNARRALELTVSSADRKSKGSLYWVINNTRTGMGARQLKKWIISPCTDETTINKRLDIVEVFVNDIALREGLRNILDNIYDIERISGRLSYGFVEPLRLRSLAVSLKYLPKITEFLSNSNFQLFDSFIQRIHNFDELANNIISAIISDNDVPTHLKEGGVIADGYDAELDEYRTFATNAEKILSDIELREREETGIKTLKVSYTRVFGYFIEVPKARSQSVPYRYTRKQTLANAERYITEELKDIQDKILNAKEKAIERETELYNNLLKETAKCVIDIMTSAQAIAELDCLLSNAVTAVKYNYTKPIIRSDIDYIKITEGRHPVVERLIKEVFVPNDTFLNKDDSRIMLITGPNMSGKSVYMRQVALIALMAHTGSFVPAKAAEISILDKIFTRIGASDDLSTGRSTFMVEMSEVSYIMQNATDNSLILFDEVGRGTSTYDGLSIAYALLEYMLENTKTKTLFSTHYHELTELENSISGIKNYKTTVREVQNTIIFMRKLLRGGANKSFGVEVAALSGLPKPIVERAKVILNKLENLDIARQTAMAQVQQLSFFNDTNRSKEIINILKDTDPDNITPRQAMDILIDLCEKVANND